MINNITKNMFIFNSHIQWELILVVPLTSSLIYTWQYSSHEKYLHYISMVGIFYLF